MTPQAEMITVTKQKRTSSADRFVYNRHLPWRSLAFAAVLLGLFYTFLVPAGMPADEPSHFANVEFYAKHWCLPVLGQPGVTYEGQMGPLYYFMSAILYSAANNFGRPCAFYLLRVSGLVLMPLVIYLSSRIMDELEPSNAEWKKPALLFMSLNPTLLAIASSIQNDYSVLALSMAAMLAVIKLIAPGRGSARHAVFTGVLISAAILTKSCALYLIPAAVVYAFLVMPRKHAIKISAILIVVTCVLTGWWFVRNFQLYGDISAQAGLMRFHYGNNGPPSVFSAHELATLTWAWQAYLWMPAGYYRGIWHAATWMRAGTGLIVVSGVIGLILSCKSVVFRFANRTIRKPWLFLSIAYGCCALMYLYSYFRITSFAPRVTFSSIVIYAIFLCLGICHLWRRILPSSSILVAPMLGASLVIANIYALSECVLTGISFVKW